MPTAGERIRPVGRWQDTGRRTWGRGSIIGGAAR
jgi:hypothetical protein